MSGSWAGIVDAAYVDVCGLPEPAGHANSRVVGEAKEMVECKLQAFASSPGLNISCTVHHFIPTLDFC